jgi:hypothetical protein
MRRIGIETAICTHFGPHVVRIDRALDLAYGRAARRQRGTDVATWLILLAFLPWAVRLELSAFLGSCFCAPGGRSPRSGSRSRSSWCSPAGSPPRPCRRSAAARVGRGRAGTGDRRQDPADRPPPVPGDPAARAHARRQHGRRGCVPAGGGRLSAGLSTGRMTQLVRQDPKATAQYSLRAHFGWSPAHARRGRPYRLRRVALPTVRARPCVGTRRVGAGGQLCVDRLRPPVGGVRPPPLALLPGNHEV